MDDTGAAPPAAPPPAPVQHQGRRRGRHGGEDVKGRQFTVPLEVAEAIEEERDRIDGSRRPMGLDCFAVALLRAGLEASRADVPDWKDPLAHLAGNGGA